MKIRAIVKANEYSNTYYHRDFEVVEKVPHVGEEYEGRLVVKVIQLHMDAEDRATSLGEYNLYKVDTKWVEGEEDEPIEQAFYVAYKWVDDVEEEEDV